MSQMIKKIAFVFMVLVFFGGSAWGGWFSFEPNMKLLDGTAVARYLDDIEHETVFLEKGDQAQADQLITDEKVYRIKDGQDMTRVKFLDFEERAGNVFVHVEDETGTKVWARINGLACLGPDGKEKSVTKQDLEKDDFKPLPKEN